MDSIEAHEAEEEPVNYSPTIRGKLIAFMLATGLVSCASNNIQPILFPPPEPNYTKRFSPTELPLCLDRTNIDIFPNTFSQIMLMARAIFDQCEVLLTEGRHGGCVEVNFTVEKKPNLGEARIGSNHATINLGEISYATRVEGSVRTLNALAHEIGHAVGLPHDLDPENLMFEYASSSIFYSKLTREQCAVIRTRAGYLQW